MCLWQMLFLSLHANFLLSLSLSFSFSAKSNIAQDILSREAFGSVSYGCEKSFYDSDSKQFLVCWVVVTGCDAKLLMHFCE